MTTFLRKGEKENFSVFYSSQIDIVLAEVKYPNLQETIEKSVIYLLFTKFTKLL